MPGSKLGMFRQTSLSLSTLGSTNAHSPYSLERDNSAETHVIISMAVLILNWGHKYCVTSSDLALVWSWLHGEFQIGKKSCRSVLRQ